MFNLFAKKAASVTPLLDKLDVVMQSMRDTGNYAPLKALHEVFVKLDDPKLKLSADQDKSIRIYLDQIEEHPADAYIKLIEFECREIIARSEKSGILTDKEEDLRSYEYNVTKANIEIAVKSAELERLEAVPGNEVEVLRLKTEIEELMQRRQKNLEKFKQRSEEQY